MFRRLALLTAASFVAALVGCGDGHGGGSRPVDVAPASERTTTIAPGTTIRVPTIDAQLEAERAWYRAPGALAVVRSGGQTWRGSSGVADLDGTAITDATTFRIASITKTIVAALVLDAVQQGLVALDDDVDDLVPGVIRPDPPVTVRMLLNHTSGLFNLDDGNPVADSARLTDPALRAEADEVWKRYASEEPLVASDRLLIALAETNDRYFLPGTGYHYSNTNYQLAAMVLERMTGKRLAELLRTRIVEPLGLHHTWLAPAETASPLLRGYGTRQTDGSLVDLTDDLVTFGNGGNGGIVSTADELLTMLQALVSGDLIDKELVDDMRRPTARSRETYGLGIGTYHLRCGTFYGHEGGVDGTASIAIVSEDGQAGTVIAVNLRDGSDPKLPALAEELLCPRLAA
jgi:D-alanyl-D-alanine carboxypeptidase